ncbi:MAG: DUF47 family protein [Verrucomicrobia bacterium]|nr:DUF47 family protein [Verrucomicrobiota bacterium]
MISFQQILGREDEFFALLEASAQEACNSVAALKHLFTTAGGRLTLAEFVEARRKDKLITEQITEMLVTTFVTPMEREDLESLAEALYKIPKTVEKFAERYMIVADQIHDVDFSQQVQLLEQASHLVLQMIQALRAGRNLGGIKSLQASLQRVESEADDLILEMIQPFYVPGYPALKAVILNDLFELIEKSVDRCRDAGNVVSHVLLKNC